MLRTVFCQGIAMLVAVAALGAPPKSQTSQPCTESKEKKTMPAADATTVKTLVQLVLDIEGLQQYFHVEEIPERKPLRLAKTEAVKEEPGVVKFGVPVVYEDLGDLARSGKPYFEFTRLLVNPDLAYAAFAYPEEGVRGEAWFIKEKGTWRLGASSLREQ